MSSEEPSVCDGQIAPERKYDGFEEVSPPRKGSNESFSIWCTYEGKTFSEFDELEMRYYTERDPEMDPNFGVKDLLKIISKFELLLAIYSKLINKLAVEYLLKYEHIQNEVNKIERLDTILGQITEEFGILKDEFNNVVETEDNCASILNDGSFMRLSNNVTNLGSKFLRCVDNWFKMLSEGPHYLV
jgi:hypothetical protein